MIKIPCSLLEEVRKAPTAHAQILATSDKPRSGGSFGMFAHWQNTAKLVHTGSLSRANAFSELQNRFIRFDDNIRNRTKQTYLLEKLAAYFDGFDKQKFKFIETRHQMRWDIIEGVRLTGLTPWVVAKNDTYYSYIVTETEFDWRAQLRFPLIQKYLIDNHIQCEIGNLQVGTYCLSTDSFDFKCYDKLEINNWLSETGNLFETVLKEYQKYKK